MDLDENSPVYDSSTFDNVEDDAMLIDLPTSLIITNVGSRIFNDENEKKRFEGLFRYCEDEATFQYFKSFRRVRVNFVSSEAAAAARIQLHQATVADERINCYFAQPTAPKDEADDGHLQPPAREKQFLISPPASPPVGWEPVEEAEPCINYDLLAAVANLAPGEAHELHPATEDKPGIFVHICEAPGPKDEKPAIVQTRCPDRPVS